MLVSILSAAVLVLPAAISVLLDCKFSGSRKSLVSKYIFYWLTDNITLLSLMFITCFARFTPFDVFNSWTLLACFGAFSFAVGVILPIIVRKRLPGSLVGVLNYVLRHEVAFSALSVLSAALMFLPRVLSDKKEDIFTNGAVLGISVLSLVVSVAVICIYRLLKGIGKDGIKNTVAGIKKHFREGKDTEFNKRFGIAAVVAFAFAFSVILFVPFETYLGNAKEFMFEFSSFWWIVAVEAVLYILLLLVVELALPKRLFDLAVGLVFGITLASYVQSMFLNGNMALMNGGNETWSTSTLAVNALVWVVIALVPAVLAVTGLKFWKTVCTLGCVLIVGMQSVALVSMMVTVERPRVESRLTQKGLYDVAPDNNVIVFVVDCFDQDNVDGMLAAEPDILDGLRGFTCYDNVTGSYCYTHIAVPYLISGERIPEYNPTNEQYENALNISPYYNTLTENISNVGIYTEEFCLVGEAEREKVDNLGSSKGSQLNIDTAIYASQRSSFYRVAPLFLKKYFTYTSDDFNWSVLSTKKGVDFYSVSPRSDANMLDRLQSRGLKVNQKYTDGCFRFIHTSGAHEPWKLDKNGNYSVTSTNKTDSSLGSIKLVSQYLKRLHEAGVYEESTIIITSDHGTCKSYHVEDESELSINPIMFYKPAGAGYDQPCIRSTAPVSHDDVFPTVMDAFGFEYSNEHGMDLDEITEDTERTRYYYWCRYEPDMPESAWSFMHVEYAINGDSRNDENWKATGKIAHCNGWVDPEK